MAWTAADINRLAQGSNNQKKWTANDIAALAKGTNSQKADTKEQAAKKTDPDIIRARALQQYTERHASDMGEVDARNEPSQALRASSPRVGATGVSGKFPLDAGSSVGRKMAGAATENSGSGPARQMPEAAARALDMGQKWGVPAKSGNVLENVGSGAMAYGTGRAQELRASFAKDSVPDEFDRINQWMDTGDNKNLADAVRRVDNTHGAYTDADLIRKGGWTQAQIDEARKMNAALDAIPAWKRYARRAANAIGGIGDTVAAAPLLGAEYGVQAGKNIDATLKNWKQVEQEVKGDEHAQSLFNLLTDVDMDYNPTWPESRNRELISMGYNSKEIREMRQRLAGLEVSDGIDKNQSVGYQLYDRGQQLTAAAQSGLSPTQRAVAGAVTSAAENLAVAGVNPAAVLPVLSAQGAAEAMGQSAEKGESAGKALGGGLAKFGAGWAINSVGAADLAKTMGSDYAKDTMAGQIADWVQGLAGSSELAKRYPAVAAAISGGIDNSMQAFAETYADMAIDAALGDSEAAKNLFSKDTFLTALESGLSGGASGALGGAVGTGLRSMSEGLDRATAPAAAAAEATKNISGREGNLSPFPSADAARERSSPNRGNGDDRGQWPKQGGAVGAAASGMQAATQQTLGAATRAQSAFLKGNSTESAAGRKMAGLATEGSGIVNETAVNDDPAVHTAAQNAGIEEYKNSVDPGLAEYVDRVRAGEKLEPYVVAETGDRMRSAMMELTGLEKVGDRTLMDSNAVQHITNRHAGGDGSADGTMKESADVARAAYVLNNFDNAYLAKDRADGYMTSKGKRAPIVIFEKKIDGSHVVVEAVCDTKKNTNYIVTEYLAKNGVDLTEVTKGLRSPVSAASDPEVHVRNVVVDPSATAEELQSSMDAASDPRDTPETLADLPSAKTNIAPEGGVVNGRSYAEETLTADESALDSSGWASGEQKAAAAQLARAGRVSTQGVQTIVDNMPDGIGAGVYTQAAKALYRMGVNEVGSFAEALKLTGPEGSMGGAVRQVLALGKQGENALNLAYMQGKGEAEVYNAHKAGELGGGKGVVRPDAGTVYRGDKAVSEGKSADEAFLKLTAQSTGTAIHRMMQGLENNAKGYIRAAAGEMFFAGDAGSETVMHETFHALNQWSAETGQAVMDRLLNYLVQQSGAESTEKLIQSYLDKYAEAGQHLTYNQALEEITADAMETVFGTAESFRDFVRQQAAEARMNAEARGIVGKAMDKIQDLLESVLADVKRFLKKEPTNAAAKAAKSLTEEQLRDLRALYFEHQRTAGEKYREAIHDAKQGSKNTAPSETKDAAVKYSINPGYAEDIDNWDKNGRTKGRSFILGRTGDTLQQLGARENDIYMNGDKISTILREHPEMTLEEIKRIPEILDNPVMVLTSQNKGRSKQNTRLVMFGSVKAQDGRPVLCVLDLQPVENHIAIRDMQKLTSAYTKDVNPEGFVRSSEVLYVSENKKRTTALLRTLGFKIPSELQPCGSIGSIAYEGQNVKLEGVKFSELEVRGKDRNNNGIKYSLDPEKPAVKYQLEVDADSKDAASSGGLGDVDAQMETIQKAVEAGGNKRVSEEGLRSIAQAVRADHGSRVSAKWLTERLGALSDYLSQGKGVDWADANAFVMDMAEQIMQKSAKRNDELWKTYPELHKMSMQIEKGSAAYDEILYRYGSWANARKEAACHGVSLTYTKDGQASRWDGDFAELQRLCAELLPAETPSSAADALEAMMSAHDAIRPTLENAYDEDWDGAKQDIAMQIWQRYMNAPELANEQNAGLRKNFAEQWREMREQARQEAADARAKATLALSEKKIKDAQWAGRELAKRTAMEKARRDAQVDKVRTQKEMDNTRRSIRRLTTQLNGMLDSKKNTSSVPESIAKQVLTVARIANDSIRNKEMLGKMRKLGAMISQSAKDTGDRAGAEWLNSGMDDKIEGWLQDVEASREAALERTKKEVQRVNKRLDALAKAAEKTGADYSKEEADLKAYLAHLKMRQVEYEDGGMARMTADQLRGLREILEQTTYIVKNENKLLGEELKADIDEFAKGADKEMRGAKGLDFGKGLKGTLSQLTADYRMNSLNIQRQFERFGGYVHGGYMEKMGQMLNEGQYKKTSLIVEGTAIFDDVTGPGNLKKMDRFERELVDIGLRADDGRKWLVTRAQVAALYIQAQNQQGLHHMTHGGLKIPNMEYMVKGDKARAEHDTQTVRIGDLKFNEKGNILNESGDAATELEQMKLLGTQKGNLLTELSKYISADDEMGEYTRKVLDDYKKFLQFTHKNINETSMVLSGRKKAIVENYIPQRVDEDTRAVENEGIRYDNSVGSEGFLQPRKNSSKPIYLDDIFSVVNTSLENVAQYAGMAVPLRNVNKLLSTQIEGRNLNAAIRDVWGRQGADYMEHAIKDMYPQRQKAEVGDRMSARLRGSAAGAVLTFNMNVTFMQAASLPTAAAEAGFGSTGHAAVQFAKNVDPLNKLMSAFGLTENRLKKVEAEIAEHGDPLLQYRLRGTKSGELGTAAEVKSWLTKLHDGALEGNVALRGLTKAYDGLKNSITKADEVTVAALWEAAKDYVVKNPSEFDAEAQQKGSAAYWAAANKAFQRIVERTQPNYTTMQRTGFQRSGNQFMKFLMMYSTQRQQNMQIAISAGEDLAAQLRRQSAAPSAENAEAVKKAGVRLARAVSSQITAAVVISSMSTLVKLLLHRRKDLQDKNGDITTKKVLSTIFWGAVESLASNPVGGSELYSGISSVVKGNDYDAVSISGVSAVNDIVANVSTFWKEAAKDATEMDEEEAAKHKEKLKKDFSNILGSLSQLFNIPYSNIKKYADAAEAYMDDWQNGTLFDFSSTPSSATGQYDRLYNAIQSGDSEEAAAAMKKLEQMGKTDKVDSQLKTRLKQYDADVLAAAEARNAGKTRAEEKARKAVFEKLREGLGVAPATDRAKGKADAARRAQLIDVVNKAVDGKADELLAGSKDGGVYDALLDELENGRVKDVQAEISRLMTAGKDKGSIKTKITNAVKEEYLAGSDGDRERLEKKLLALEDADGNPLYEEKDFAQWVNQADKKAEKAKDERNWWEGVK